MTINETIELNLLTSAVRDTSDLIEQGSASAEQVEAWRAYVSKCLARIAELSN